MADMYQYLGNDNAFQLGEGGKILYQNGEAVELTADEANFINNYPYGRHRVVKVTSEEAKALKGTNDQEVVNLYPSGDLEPVEETPSSSGHGVVSATLPKSAQKQAASTSTTAKP